MATDSNDRDIKPENIPAHEPPGFTRHLTAYEKQRWEQQQQLIHGRRKGPRSRPPR